MKLNWAERWVVNNPLRIFQQKVELRLLKRMMDLDTGSAVMEVGCGRGAGAELIFHYFHPNPLHLLDLDIQMIQKAKRRLSLFADRQIPVYVVDITKIPFKSKTQDAVFGFGVLHHIPNWRAAVDEIARVLKRGGIYYLEELYPSLYQNWLTKRILLHPKTDRFVSRDLKTALLDAGFTLKQVIERKRLGILGVAVKS